ncbi:hypothetical protein K2173_025074 [Erythroxylum novogranatense]|uniref:DUF2470 domain-containing protein n=1 Tax=Erythroxylum novogranatense TaxID=1862640 RepID=A0AAV8SVD4_9ROSI|nr:hypothetical protein K2173_025074 [Erythroxylum novogranatense]
MHLPNRTQSLTPTLYLSPLFGSKPLNKIRFTPLKQNPVCQLSLKCSLSTLSEPTQVGVSNSKPFPAEVSRTIMELSSVGTLSTLTHEGWPLGVGVRFAVDDEGTPVLCLSESQRQFSADKRSSLHVQLEQCGMRTPQCTIQGFLEKPEEKKVLKWLHASWKKRFGEVPEDLIYIIAVDSLHQMEDFMEDGVLVSSSEYKNASPDPLRDFAEAIVNEINTKNLEDVYRFCNVYVDLDFQVSEAKMIWIDRLGFDLRLSCPQNATFDVRIPFPGEVRDEKGAKSSFNGMSQLAWEVEKNYHAPDFPKVKQLKRVKCWGV